MEGVCDAGCLVTDGCMAAGLLSVVPACGCVGMLGWAGSCAQNCPSCADVSCILYLSPQTASNTRSLGKRDAVAFVRAVRRYGLRSRLPDIASEAGGAVEAAGRQAQELLWEELVQGCRQALERAAEQDKQQGTLHDPRVSSTDRHQLQGCALCRTACSVRAGGLWQGHGCSIIDARVALTCVRQGGNDEQPHCCDTCCAAQNVTLDFFGCAVKASEFSQHLAAMELLSAQVKALQSKLAGLPAFHSPPTAPSSVDAAVLPAVQPHGCSIAHSRAQHALESPPLLHS